MATTSKTTTDHDIIRRWAEKRGAVPSTVARTRSAKDVGVIRLDFPGFSGEGSLQQISWDEFFDKFDTEGLAFVFQEKTAAGRTSNFNRFVKREAARSRMAAKRMTPAKRTAGRGTKKTAAKTSAKRPAAKRPATKRAGAPKRSTASSARRTTKKRTRA